MLKRIQNLPVFGNFRNTSVLYHLYTPQFTEKKLTAKQVTSNIGQKPKTVHLVNERGPSEKKIPQYIFILWCTGRKQKAFGLKK